MEPQFLTLDEVLEVYRDQIKRFGGTLGCMIMRSRNRLWPLRNQDSAGTAFTANCSKWLRPTQHSSNNTSNRSHPASPILPPSASPSARSRSLSKAAPFLSRQPWSPRRREFALVESLCLPRCHRHHLRVALAIPRTDLDWDWAACFGRSR